MADNRKQVKEQMKFCKELMNRLDKSIADNVNEDSSWWGIRNHSQMQNDIVRLRRELNTLNKLLYPWGE
ncbi:MAG: hypothetical protein UHM23_08835 [Clostridia bacterium]|nr:hypothetical protein [Clostridia bacterium]